MAGRIGWAAAALTAGLFAGGAASAQAPGQLYLKAFGGATFPQSDDFTLHSTLTGASAQSGLDFDTGYVAGFAGGYKITPNVAVELEYAYRSADVSVNKVSDGGKSSATAVMVNGIYKFDPMGATGAFRPYAGLGLGAAKQQVADVGNTLTGDATFAYQLIGGVSYDLSPEFSLLGELRFFGINDQTLENDAFSFKSPYHTLDLLVGGTYSF